MMKNRFYTLLVIPEKTSQMKRWIIPSWIVHGLVVLLTVGSLITGMMIFDYWHLLNQIHRNKQLQIENRKLRQQVQIFQNKVSTIESTLERIKSFSTRLKVIMNLEGQGTQHQGQLPEAHLNIPAAEILQSTPNPPSFSTQFLSTVHFNSKDDFQQKEYAKLEFKLHHLSQQTFETEEILQDQYEILYDKKSFLAALPTRQPAAGYFTSGFGVRVSPFGNFVKMHEGLDIANHSGTQVFAPAAGEVVFLGSKSGYGLTLMINHGYGIETLYGHLQKFAVKKGDKVKRGDQIAFLGNTGISTAPHVHYEVHVRGYPVDPRPYIFETSTH